MAVAEVGDGRIDPLLTGGTGALDPFGDVDRTLETDAAMPVALPGNLAFRAQAAPLEENRRIFRRQAVAFEQSAEDREIANPDRKGFRACAEHGRKEHIGARRVAKLAVISANGLHVRPFPTQDSN